MEMYSVLCLYDLVSRSPGMLADLRAPFPELRTPPSCPSRCYTQPLLPATPNYLLMMPAELLVDVRSSVEFATGPLSSDIAPTVNIEYQIIDQLADIYAARGINVAKDDNITLYCRSGRRSNIALQTLKNMGYQNVRDIGGFDAARAVLDREQVQRQLDGEMEIMGVGKTGHQMEGVEEQVDEKKHVRVKSFGALVEGLKALEE